MNIFIVLEPSLVPQFNCMQEGYSGFYSRNTIPLTPKVVNDIHKRGGTILGTSQGEGGNDTLKIVDSIQDRGINQVYILGGDGTQRGASVIFEVIVKMLVCRKLIFLGN